jgi:hypothetical protein
MSGTWDIAAKVRDQLETGSVWQDRDSVDNYDGVVRAIRAAPQDAAEFAEAVAACLVSENLLVRSGAAATLPEVARAIGPERLRRIVEENLPLFRGVKSAVRTGEPDLEGEIRRFIGR